MRCAVRQTHGSRRGRPSQERSPSDVMSGRRRPPSGSDVTTISISQPGTGTNLALLEPRAGLSVDGLDAEAESRGIDIVAFQAIRLADSHRGLLQEHEWQAGTCQGYLSSRARNLGGRWEDELALCPCRELHCSVSELDSGRRRQSRGSAGARSRARGRSSPQVPSPSSALPDRGCRSDSAESGRLVRAASPGRGSRDRCRRYDVTGPRGRCATPAIRVRPRRSYAVLWFGR